MRHSTAWMSGMILLFSSIASADISYTGTFTTDDQMFETTFSLAAATGITVRTWSFAGGTDAAGDVISAGGFAPVVSVFDSSGSLLQWDDGGTARNNCGPRNIDPVSGFCLDAYINGLYNPGTYTVVLTEYDNLPNGPTLANGFSEEGNGNFTGGPFFLNAGSGYQRNGNWELDVPGTPVPEPAQAAPLALLLGFLVSLIGRWQERKNQNTTLRKRLVGKLVLLLCPFTAGAVTLHVSGDAYISQSNPTLNFGNSPTLNVSQSDFALLQFDLSPLPASVTAANIQKATLTVFVNKAFSSGNLALGLAPTPWQELTATYNNVGLPIVTTPYTMAVNASDTYVTFDVTSIVASWISNPSANYGLELYSFEGSASLSLDSKEATATSHAATIDVTLKLQGNCQVGQVVTGFDQNGSPSCAPPITGEQCSAGQAVVSISPSGALTCSPFSSGTGGGQGPKERSGTPSGGKATSGASALAGFQCQSGAFLIGFDDTRKPVCGNH